MRFGLPHAIIFGCVLIAAALFFGGSNPAIGQKDGPRGPFMISATDQNYVWRIDQATGMVSYCFRDSGSTDRGYIKSRPPYCSMWGE